MASLSELRVVLPLRARRATGWLHWRPLTSLHYSSRSLQRSRHHGVVLPSLHTISLFCLSSRLYHRHPLLHPISHPPFVTSIYPTASTTLRTTRTVDLPLVASLSLHVYSHSPTLLPLSYKIPTQIVPLCGDRLPLCNSARTLVDSHSARPRNQSNEIHIIYIYTYRYCENEVGGCYGNTPRAGITLLFVWRVHLVSLSPVYSHYRSFVRLFVHSLAHSLSLLFIRILSLLLWRCASASDGSEYTGWFTVPRLSLVPKFPETKTSIRSESLSRSFSLLLTHSHTHTLFQLTLHLYNIYFFSVFIVYTSVLYQIHCFCLCSFYIFVSI